MGAMERTDYKRILSEKIIAMFPDPLMRNLVHGELATYGRETYEREGDRVRVAILKVAGASLEQIREWLAIA